MNSRLITCCACDLEFPMDAGFYERRVKDGKGWYCPNGHKQLFNNGPTAKEKLEVAMKWIAGAPHHDTCDSLIDKPCSCGKDAL